MVIVVVPKEVVTLETLDLLSIVFFTRVAWLVVMLLGMQVVLRLIPASGTFFCEDLAMKIFLLPYFLFCCFEKSNCQLNAKECMLSTDKVPLGGLLGNNVVRITDHPNMTSVVYHGRNVINQTEVFCHGFRLVR